MYNFADIDKSPSLQKRASFALTLCLVALGGGCLIWVEASEQAALWFGGTVAAIGTLALLPIFGRFIYVGWFGLGIAIGVLTSPFILGALFVLTIIPAGLVMKVIGRDPMKRRLSADAASYWEDYSRPPDPRSYFRQW